MKNDKTKRVYIVERLAEWDRDVVSYAKDQQLLVTTNNCQPSVKLGESWVQVNFKNDVEKVSNRYSSLEYDKSARRSSKFVPIRRSDSKLSTGAFDLNTETNVLEPQILGTVRRGVPKRKLNADEKLDKICTLLETVISTSLSPPSKSNKLETLQNTSDEETDVKNSN